MGMIFKGLTFGGVNSLDYGIFITGEAVYNAPERSVTSIEIEGRNGDLLIDNGRFLNIEIKYPAGCFAETQEDFKQKIESFRNAIISQISYQRLTDDYNPDEYRLAVYKSGLDVSVAVLHQGGEFNLTFDCKPQRFLTSGETERSIPEWSDLHTDSGSPVTVDNSSGEYAVKSLSTDIVPQQDLNGYDHPWAGGAGKNVLNNADAEIGTAWNGNSNADRARLVIPCQASTTYVLSLNGTISISGIYLNWTNTVPAPSAGTNILNSLPYSFTTDSSAQYVVLGFNKTSVTQTDIGNLKLQLEIGSSPTSYSPYENICPITGFDSANIYVSPTTSVGDATTYTVSFGSAGTVYGGTLDVVSGQLTVTYKSFTFDGTQNVTDRISAQNRVYYQISDMATGSFYSDDNVMCNRLEKVSSVSNEAGTPPAIVIGYSNNYVYIQGVKNIGGANITDLASFNTWVSANNIVITYPLATPLTYQLTATQVALLLGTNNIWSNTGDIQIEYGKGGNTLFNPTLFDSKPLLVVTGYGNLGIGSQTLTIEGDDPTQEIHIDCEAMEAWTESGGVISPANDLIQNAGDAFPVLKSGANIFSLPVTITALKVTPRWWRI